MWRLGIGEQAEGVGQHGKDGVQRGEGAARGAGQVDDERGAEQAAEAAAEHGEGRLLAAGGAHLLGEAIEKAGADGAGGLRGDIARGDAGAACGDDERRAGGSAGEGCFNLRLLIGNQSVFDHVKPSEGQGLGDGGAGEVLAEAAGRGVADGNHYCLEHLLSIVRGGGLGGLSADRAGRG